MIKLLKNNKIIKSLLADFPDAAVYLVGGSVRDLLLKKNFEDIDIVVQGINTDTLESFLKKLGEVDDSGKKFGVFKIDNIEIALPREETYNNKGSRFDVKAEIKPSLDIAADLSRRDFTINGMAINLKTGKTIDPFNGKADLGNKIIRVVGEPLIKFSQDNSRILRALRLSVELGFSLDAELIASAKQIIQSKDLEKTIDKKTWKKEFELSWNRDPGRAVFTWNKMGLGKQIKNLILETPRIEKEPKIISEDSSYLVISKPAGLKTHSPVHTGEPSLVNWLLRKNFEMIEVGEDAQRPGIVHRLDKEVSGVMVVAKTHASFFSLKQSFQAHKVKKEYWAVVVGKVGKDEGTIEFPIKRSRRTGKFIITGKGEDSKQASTKFETIKKLRGDYTFLRVFPLTGKTHQIRVHLKSIGHPIVGDPLYQTKGRHAKAKTEHLLLHSYSIGFPDLKGNVLKFRAEPPDYFNNFIKRYE